MKKWCLFTISFVTVALIMFASTAQAQSRGSLRVRVENPPGTPLAGALVALVDDSNRVQAEGISSSAGQITLTAISGDYRVRVRRVGYRPFYSGVISLPREEELVMRVESPRVQLGSIVVSAKAQCGRRNRDAAALAEVWEEIAKALLAKRLNVDDLSSIGITSVYKHDLRADGTIEKADTTFFAESSVRPFTAIDPASLVRDGYVRGNVALGWEYFGPDEIVLLSDGFAETHCFSLMRKSDRPGELGLSFDPAPKRKQSDIKGVLWIDEQTSELREVTFQYVNVDELDKFETGGFTRFRRMPSGSWIVEEWKLRMPKLELKGSSWNNVRVIGYVENGGSVLGHSFK